MLAREIVMERIIALLVSALGSEIEDFAVLDLSGAFENDLLGEGIEEGCS
jgi:hypothetical protein